MEMKVHHQVFHTPHEPRSLEEHHSELHDPEPLGMLPHPSVEVREVPRSGHVGNS